MDPCWNLRLARGARGLRVPGCLGRVWLAPAPARPPALGIMSYFLSYCKAHGGSLLTGYQALRARLLCSVTLKVEGSEFRRTGRSSAVTASGLCSESHPGIRTA